MIDAGAPALPPGPPTAADETRQRQSLVQTVAVFAALLFTLVFAITVIVLQAILEQAALSALGALLVTPLLYLTYRLVSRHEPVLQRLAWLERWLPPLGVLLAEKRRRQAIGTVVERLEYVVSFYGLDGIFGVDQLVLVTNGGSLSFRHPLRDELIDVIAAHVGAGSWPDELIDELVRRNAWTAGEPELLLLFYQERLERVDRALWHRIVSVPATLDLAARKLLASGRLPLADSIALRAEDLVVVLKGMNRFELDGLRERVRRLNSLGERASHYLDFLRHNEVAPAPDPPVLKILLDIIERTVNRDGFDPGCFEVEAAMLIEIGRESIRRAIDQTSEGMLGRYSRLAAVIFLMRSFPRHPARELLCRELAEDREAVGIAWAYLDLKEDLRSEHRLGGRPFLSVSHLIEQWPAKLDSAKGNAEIAKEVEALTDVLRRGEWLVHLSDLLQGALRTRLQQLITQVPTSPGPQPPHDELASRALHEVKLDRRPDLLRRLFRDLDFETIERNLETRRFTPYLITFDTEHGPLARLIDCLTSPKKPKKGSQAGGQAFEDGGRAKYNFRPYTENTRIGLVPPGRTFEEFRKEFQQDLSRVLENRKKLVPHDWTKDLSGIEVMLHRFEAFGRSHYPFVSEFSSRFALRSIKDLLADNLAPEELLTLVQYGGGSDLRARILDSSIPDVVGADVRLKPVERTELEGEDGLMKGELSKRLAVKNIPELGQRLHAGEIQLSQAEDELTKIIHERSPRFTENRSRLIAKAYLRGIESLAA